jgi:uncharacterized protein YndB with AHSA1/START domain
MTSNTQRDTHILGSLRSADGTGVVRIEDRFDTDIDDLWSAITDPDRLARWYGQIEGDLHLGGEYHAHVFASGWEGTGRIEACEPPRRLVTVSRDPDEPNEGVTEVTLTPDGDQTILVYEHRGVPLDLLYAYGAGEQIHVEDLADYIAGRERREAEARWNELEPAYRDLAANVR